jgi:carboxylesterase
MKTEFPLSGLRLNETARPIFRNKNSDVLCYCVHGFTGVPGVFFELADALAVQGFAAAAPLLPGHGTRQEELRGVQFRDWYGAVKNSYLLLAPAYKKVIIIGISLGGALATKLAAEFADGPEPLRPAAVVLISPCYKIKNKFAVKPLLVPLKRLTLTMPSDGNFGRGDFSGYGYNKLPAGALIALADASTAGRGAVPFVRAATLVLCTKADGLADYNETNRQLKRFSSNPEVFVYEKVPHNLLLGPEHKDAVRRIVEFVCSKSKNC